MEGNSVLKRKAQFQSDGDSKTVKVDNIFGNSDVDKENDLAPDVKITANSSGSDDDEGPDTGEIVLNIESLRKFQQVIDPSFDLDEIESRDRLDSQAAYDRALVARAQQRRLPGKVAKLVDEGKVSQSRPHLSVSKYGRSQSFGGTRSVLNDSPVDPELERMALTPDERQREIIARMGIQSTNPLAGLARAFKHGPRRSFGKSRNQQEGDSSPKQSPATRPKPKPKVPTKPNAEEKEEKSGGFLFRRRSFNDKKGDNFEEQFKGSPKVGKKFGFKIGGTSSPSTSKKPIISTPKPFTGSLSESVGESDSVMSIGSSIISENIPSPSKSLDQDSSVQKTSTPQGKGTGAESKREATPGTSGEQDSFLYKDPQPLFGHRSVLFGSAEFDAIFEKFSKEDEKSDSMKSPSHAKPSPAKKPEVTAKPSRKGQGDKTTGAIVSDAKSLFEKKEESAHSPQSGRRPVGKRKFFDEKKYSEGSSSKSTPTILESEASEDVTTKVTKDEKLASKSSSKTTSETAKASSLLSKYETVSADKDPLLSPGNDKDEDAKVSSHTKTKGPLFDDDDDIKTTSKPVPQNDVLFGESDGEDEDDDVLKVTGESKSKTIGLLFGDDDGDVKKTTKSKFRSSLFDDDDDDDKKVVETKPGRSIFDNDDDESKPIETKRKTPLFDDDGDVEEAPKPTVYGQLFSGEPKPDTKPGSLFDKDSDGLFETEVKTSVTKVKDASLEVLDLSKSPAHLAVTTKEDSKEPRAEDKEDDSPSSLFGDNPSSTVQKKDENEQKLLSDEPVLTRSGSIFEDKRSKSEEDLFSLDDNKKESATVKESENFLIVDVQKKEAKALLQDEELIFDDSTEIEKLKKKIEKKENVGDDFVLVSSDEIPSTDDLIKEDSLREKKEDSPLEKTEDVPVEKISEKELEEPEVTKDSVKPVVQRENSADLVQAAIEKKEKTPLKEDKKPTPSDKKPSWMVDLQRRREKSGSTGKSDDRAVKTDAKEKKVAAPFGEVKLKKSAQPSVGAKTAAKKDSTEANSDMPEWRKKIIERQQRQKEVAESLKSTTSSYTSSRRQREKRETSEKVDIKVGARKTERTAEQQDRDKKATSNKADVKPDLAKSEKMEDSTNHENESKRNVERESVPERAKSPKSPVSPKPPINPKPSLDPDKSNERPFVRSKSPSPEEILSEPSIKKLPDAVDKKRTDSTSSESRKKSTVEVTVSSRRSLRHSSTSSNENADEKPKTAEKAEVRLSSSEPGDKAGERSPKPSEEKVFTKEKPPIATKVSSPAPSSPATKKTHTNVTSSSSTSVPKWKQDLQKKKDGTPSKKPTSIGLTSPTTKQPPGQGDNIPQWKRDLLEKKKRQRTPTPTSDQDREPSPVKPDKVTSAANYRSVLTTRTTPAVLKSPSSSRKSAANKEVPEFMKEFKLKRRNSQRDSKS